MTTKTTTTPPVQSNLAVLEPEDTAAQPQPTPEAVAPPRGPIHTAVLPIALVALDIEVREKYLSSDIEIICGIVEKARSAVLTMNAGHPLENRENAFKVWRKRVLQDLLNACPPVGIFLGSHPEQAVEFHAGTIDLLALDRMIHDDLHEADRQRMERLSAQKEKLREALAANWHEPKEIGHAKYLVVRADGEMIMCNNSMAGKEWGAIGNHGFYLIPLAFEGMRRFLPA